jgi:hypothetical protein
MSLNATSSASDDKICKMVYAITTKGLVQGYLPTSVDALMRLFERVPATKETLQRLARENKFIWVRDMCCEQSPEEYKKEMNKALLKYLSS